MVDWTSINKLEEIEQRVTRSNEEGLRARWEFGREVLAQRSGRQLPRAYLAQVVERTGVNKEEIRRRMRFAERYPSEDELSHAVTEFGSWHAVVAEGLYEKKGEGKERKSKGTTKQKDKPERSIGEQFAAELERLDRIVRKCFALIEQTAGESQEEAKLLVKQLEDELYDHIELLTGEKTEEAAEPGEIGGEGEEDSTPEAPF
jgi:hypothetical protein